MGYAPQLKWVPAEENFRGITLLESNNADFGRIIKEEQSRGFRLETVTQNHGFIDDVSVKANQRHRFHIVAMADNAKASRTLIVEVAWDGIWSDDRATMLTHLRVT